MSDDPRNSLNPSALPLADAARVLSTCLRQTITVEMLQIDIGAGAPRNADGTINMVRYAAWLVRERGRNGD